MMNRPTKAIIGVAGYGTRMMPITKAVEKCMLPLLNRPVIDYVVQDCIRAGITDIYFVVSPGSTQLQHYYSRDVELEAYLVSNNKQHIVPSVQPPEGIRFHYREQDLSKYGTTVPLWAAHNDIADGETFLFILGDQTLYRPEGDELQIFVDQVLDAGLDAGMIGVEVPEEEVEKYGIIDLDENHYFRRIVEKPRRNEAPSNLNNGSIFLLNHRVMEYAERQLQQPTSGEYFLTDVINDFVAAGNNLYVRRSDAEYLDCGSVESWVRANSWLLNNKTA